MSNIFQKNNSGFTIIEVLIASVIISLTSLALMSATTKGIELSEKSLKQTQANMLIEEGVEAIKTIRDNNWVTIENLSMETVYYLSFDTNNNTWSLGINPTNLIDEIFTRQIIFSNVYRDANDDIASSGTIDDGIKKVQVTVSWPYGTSIISKNIDFYLTNFLN